MSENEKHVLYALNSEERKKIYALIGRYWDDWINYWENKSKYRENKEIDPYVIYPSIPIVWFGNINEYFKSPVKIVTVGLNPSNHEFSNDGTPPYKVETRFKDAEEFEKNREITDFANINENSLYNLIKAYNNYFKYKLYPDYFSAFERVLQNLPIPSSYGDVEHEPPKELYGTSKNSSNYPDDYKQHRCTAIHIDSETAIATKYLWDKPKEDFKKGFGEVNGEKFFQEFQDVKKYLSKKKGKNEFGELFKVFLGILQPDIIVVSSKPLRDVLVKIIKKAKKVNNKEERRLFFEDFDSPAKKEDNNFRVSYIIDGRLWLYGRNNTGPGPFYLLTGKGSPEEQEQTKLKNIKKEHAFFHDSFKESGIKKLTDILEK